MSNEVVWITGGGSGIGRAVALEYARRGARVAVSGRRVDRLEEVAREIGAAGGTGLAVPCDVTDENGTQAAVVKVLEAWGRLDVAIANAGFDVSGRMADLSMADWQRQFNVNVFGATNTVHAALPAILESKGRMVLVGSVAAWLGMPGLGPYGATKAAIRSIGRSLSAELAGTGASCTTIHPGFVESEIAQVDNQGVHHPDREDKRPQRFMWKTDKAARVMVRAIDRRKGQFVFTGHGRIISAISQLWPGLADWIVQRTSVKANQRWLSKRSGA